MHTHSISRSDTPPCTPDYTHIVPSSFDPQDPDLRAVRRPYRWRWRSCEEALGAFGAHMVIMRIPALWQIEPYLHAACRAAGTPLFINLPGNLPVGAIAVKQLHADTVVTSLDAAAPFASFLKEEDISLPASWFIIASAFSLNWIIPPALHIESVRVTLDIHAIPGVPILVQCAELSKHKRGEFHLSTEYLWHHESNITIVESLANDPFPIPLTTLPYALEEKGSCTCGRIIVERTV